jgi:hypothetical protein
MATEREDVTEYVEEEERPKKRRQTRKTERSKIYHRRQLLWREPDVAQVQDALEHAIVTGSQVRRNHLRRTLHQRQEEMSEEGVPPDVGEGGFDAETTGAAAAAAAADIAAAPFVATNPAPEEEEWNNDTIENDYHEVQDATGIATNAGRNAADEPTVAATDLTTDDTAATKADLPKKPSVIVHAGDIRIYGRRSFVLIDRGFYPMKPWPRNPQFREGFGKTVKGIKNATKRSRHDHLDSEWNQEYGDSIPPVLFRLARLSGEHPTAKKQRILDEIPPQNKTLQSSDISVPLTSVPRAILERCWERAVHVASNTMAVTMPVAEPMSFDVVDLSTDATIDHDVSEVQRHQTLRGQEQQPHATPPPPHQEQPTVVFYRNERKCRSLGIALESHQLSECPRCTRTFQTPSQLKRHYYGELVSESGARNNNEQDQACCLPFIRTRALEVMDELLQQHVQSQTDQILRIVLSNVATNQNVTKQDKNDRGKAGPRHDQLLDWKVVFSHLEKAAAVEPNGDTKQYTQQQAQQNTVIAAKHPILETLQADNDVTSNPLLLNPVMVENVKCFLLDRYTPAPL